MSLMHDIRLSRKSLAGFVVIGSAWAVFFAQMPVIKEAIGASDGAYGTLVLLASLGALAAMWLAPLADRLAGRWAQPMAAVLVGGGMLLTGFATGPVLFGVAMTLAAVGSGILDVLVNVRISEAEERSGRLLMNLNHAIYSFAYAGGAVLTGFMREAGFPPVVIFGCLMAVVVLLACYMMDARSRSPAPAPQVAPGGLPGRLVWLTGLLVLVAFLTESSAEGWSALHLERTLGGGAAEGAMGPAILGLSMGVGRMAGYFLSHRLPDLKLMAGAAVLSAAGLACAGVAPALWVAYLGFGLGGLGVSVIAPLALARIGRLVPPSARLAAISRASVMGYAAFFLGPPLMGFTSEAFGLRAGFVLIAFVLLFSAVVLVPALARASDKWAPIRMSQS
jgi:MFS family permease